jgi:hypothetical protein
MSTPAWLAFIEKMAPTVASAIGTPVAGMAVSAIESALGITGVEAATIDDKTSAIAAAIQAGQLTPEQIGALKRADQDFQVQMKKLDIDLDQMQLADVEGARQMQVAKPSPVPAALSIIITIGFLGILISMLGGVNVKENEAFLILIGALGAGWTQVLNFWLGSTRHSQTTASINAQAVATAAAK